MRIENVARQEKRADKFTARFEDGSEIKVSAAQIADFGIYSGRELSANEYDELRGKLELSSSKTRALRILGNRSLSTREMQKRLISKGDSEETAQKTVEWLENIGAVSDEEYAASIVSHYSAKGYGPAKIRDELYRRGIPREVLDDAMNRLDENEEAVYEYIKKKLGGNRDKDDLQSVANALYRRGFSYEEARTAVRRYVELFEEIESAE